MVFRKHHQLEYHTFLHHSQTAMILYSPLSQLEYHTFLHHSQTALTIRYTKERLEYHTFLHHSQTYEWWKNKIFTLEYHTFLHHSQTSNSKMKCHHSHKIQVLKLLGCYISHPSLSIIYLVTPSMQSLAQVSINKS